MFPSLALFPLRRLDLFPLLPLLALLPVLSLLSVLPLLALLLLLPLLFCSALIFHVSSPLLASFFFLRFTCFKNRKYAMPTMVGRTSACQADKTARRL